MSNTKLKPILPGEKPLGRRPALYYTGSLLLVAGLVLRILSRWEIYPELIWALGALLYQAFCGLQRRELLTPRGKRLLGMATLAGLLVFVSAVVSLLRFEWWLLLLVPGVILYIYSNITLAFTQGAKGKTNASPQP